MTPDIIDWADAAFGSTLARRDVPTLFRLLRDRGISQRELSDRVGIHQSEVSEIIRGRHVRSYDVLLRICRGLGIPRGAMGLAYAGATPPPDHEKVDENVERRKFLAAASAVLFGNTALGEAGALAVADVGDRIPARVGMPDVHRLNQVTGQLRVLERRVGGEAVQEIVAAHARDAERLMRASASDAVHTKLRHAVSHAHQLAGWASGDAGRMDRCRWHFGRALEQARGHGARTAEVLCAAGAMEKHNDNSNEALKLFQLAFVAADGSRDPQISAVLNAASASAYHKLGHTDRARKLLKTSRTDFARADAAASLPFFEYYGRGNGILAAAETKMGDLDSAYSDVRKALAARPEHDVRCAALDTIVLARLLIEAGEIAKGIGETRRALDLVARVRSRRVLDRLAPLEKALAARRDSTCQDLARHVAKLRAADPDEPGRA